MGLKFKFFFEMGWNHFLMNISFSFDSRADLKNHQRDTLSPSYPLWLHSRGDVFRRRTYKSMPEQTARRPSYQVGEDHDFGWHNSFYICNCGSNLSDPYIFAQR